MYLLKKLVSFVLALSLLTCYLPVGVLAEEEEIIMEGIGFVTMSHQHLYSKPSSQSDVLDITEKNDCVVIVCEEDDDWYKVIYDLQEGYMYADSLSITEEVHVELGYGEVNSDIVYLRSGPGTEYTILSSGFRDKEFYIIGMFNGWYKVLFKKKNQDTYATGYIRSDLLDLTEIPYQNHSGEETPYFFYLGHEIEEPDYEESEQVAMAEPGTYYVPVSGTYLLAQAQNYLGVPYVFGGYSPEGFDCSGLIYYILDKIGYPCPRTAAGQYGLGYSVSRDELKAGDLVFFENTYTSGISHVGIYAGGGSFIHAPNEGSVVSYSSLSGYWSEHYYGARRIG